MSDFLPVPSEQEWTESDRQWFELVRSLRSQVVQLQTTISQLREEVRVADACVVQACTTSEPTVFNQPKPRGDIREALSGSHVLAQKPEEEAKP